jgi:hypothetical protein
LVRVLSLVVLSLLDTLHLMVDTCMGGVAVLSFKGTMDHASLIMVLVLIYRVGNGFLVVVIALIGWILLTPLLSKWLGTGLTLFVLTAVLSRLLPFTLGFRFAGGRLGGLLVDQLRRMVTGDRRWSSSLTRLMSKENIIFRDDGRERVIKVSSLETLSCVAFVKPHGLFRSSPSHMWLE